MSTDYKFEGWLGHDEKSANGNMKWGEFEPKVWEEDNVDIKVGFCNATPSQNMRLTNGTDFPLRYLRQ